MAWGADVLFLAVVSALVGGGGGEGGESFVAECAVEGLLSGVHARSKSFEQSGYA